MVAGETLRRRASQHQALAGLAHRALTGAELAEVLAEAVAAVVTLTGVGEPTATAAFEAIRAGVAVEPATARLAAGLEEDDAAFVRAVAAVFGGAVAGGRNRAAAHRHSLHDPLTGLANRGLATDRLARALDRMPAAGPDSTAAVAVFAVDLDDFQLLNDTHGRDAGDEVLIEVARRLGEAAGGGTVARMSADTFAVVCETTRPAGVDDVAAALHLCFEEPIVTARGELFVSASFGIAVAGDAQLQPDALLHDADVALLAAKQSGRGRQERFREDMRAEAVGRFEMRNAMRRALERGEFKVWFQPEFALDADRVTGFETLLRWEHPELGVVAPASFLPLAEDTGLIVPLGEWAIRQACSQLREWRAAGLAVDDLMVAVNLSTRQLSHPDLVGVVQTALSENELDPANLWIEVNESTLMTDVDSTHNGLERLHALGVVVGVDDFGTGYSSLSYLRRFPVDFLKVDRSFVAGLGGERNGDSDDEAIVAAILGMARSLGLTAVAEGVETQQARAALLRLGCDMAQGYLWSPPLPAADATAWLSARAKEEGERPAAPAAKTASIRPKRGRGRKPGARRARSGDDLGAAVAAETTRALLRVATAEEAVGLLIAAVGRIGGQVMPARLRDPHGLPYDLSLGLGEPIQPVTEPSAPARDDLDRVLPQLLDDARLAIARLSLHDGNGAGETDTLTGLLPRRAAGRALGRLGPGAVLALIEVDGIAELRTADPAAADDVLRSLSRLLRERLRGADKGGRFADDQLLVLLPGRTAEDAVDLLERTRRLWRRVRPEALTLSVGVGAVGARGAQFSLVAVDQALALAKERGGDRVELAP